MTGVFRAAIWLLVVTTWACSDEGTRYRAETCEGEDPDALVDVTGAYRYISRTFNLRGTITFAQTGTQVRVTETTYDNADDRPVVGDGDLLGNRLEMTLVPANGDTDYEADVGFLFDPDRRAFCLLGFSDTNGDVGGPGSYVGEPL